MARRKGGLGNAQHYLNLMQMFSNAKKQAGMHHVSVRQADNHPFAPEPGAQPAGVGGTNQQDDPGHIHALKLLFTKLAQQGGLHHPQFQPIADPTQVVPDENYVPLAQADAVHHTLLYNEASPAAGTMQLDKGGVPVPGTDMQGTTDQFKEATVAHETGHLLEPKLIRDRNGADQYTDATLGTQGRAPYWLENSPQGRAEVRRDPNAILQRDKWGLPTNGAGSTHTAPNEMYANDVGAAFGHPYTENVRSNRPKHNPNYALSHASHKILMHLIAQGLLPQGSKRRGR